MEDYPYLGGAVFVIVGAAFVFNVLKRMGNSVSVSNESANKESKSNVDVAKAHNKEKSPVSFPCGSMVVFFGSQTGTAESYAKIIASDAKKKGFDAKVADLEEFDPTAFASSSLSVFLLATYGEGDATDNAIKFQKWYNAEIESSTQLLSSMSYLVFGLGNRQYEHFNNMGITTDAALAQLGATRLMEIGLGDDDGTMEEDFESWRSKIWPVLLAKYDPTSTRSESTEPVPANVAVRTKVDLEFEAVPISTRSAIPVEFSPDQMNKSTKYFFTAFTVPVAVNRELRSNTIGGSTRHIELDLNGTGLSYTTADNLAVLPENDPAAVEALCRSLHLDPDLCFEVRGMQGSADFKAVFPSPCTVRTAFSRYLDLSGVPSLSVIEALMPYVTNPEQRARFETGLTQDRSLLRSRLQGTGSSLFSLLGEGGELSSCTPPLSDLLHIVPSLQPRYYTISSSALVHPANVHITVRLSQTAVLSSVHSPVDGPKDKQVQGVCSAYLQRVVPGEGVRVFFRPSSFRLPPTLSTPIVMIGPGTGLAPMRALLQERKHLWDQYEGADSRGRNTLFFGCQHSEQDFIYRGELEAYQKNVLDALHTAFSRQGPNKVYVQELLAQTAEALMRDVDAGAYIYVCGATAMGADVALAFTGLLAQHTECGLEEAAELLREMQTNGRYVQELWSA